MTSQLFAILRFFPRLFLILHLFSFPVLCFLGVVLFVSGIVATYGTCIGPHRATRRVSFSLCSTDLEIPERQGGDKLSPSVFALKLDAPLEYQALLKTNMTYAASTSTDVTERLPTT